MTTSITNTSVNVLTNVVTGKASNLMTPFMRSIITIVFSAVLEAMLSRRGLVSGPCAIVRSIVLTNVSLVLINVLSNTCGMWTS